MKRFTVTVNVMVFADDDNDARGVIDQALDEWCNGDHDETDPIIHGWVPVKTTSVNDTEV